MKNTIRTSLLQRRIISSFTIGLCALIGLIWIGNVSSTNAANAMPEKTVRVACVGDSITFGSGIKNRQHDSYPADLGRMLGAGWDVRNYGHSGATLLTKADRPYIRQKEYTNAIAFKPDVVVIMLGTNDSKHRGDGSLDADHAIDNWQYKADFVSDYEALVADFRKANPKAKIYVCLPTPCFPGRWGINNKTIHDEIIPMVHQVAKDTGAGIIDLNSALAGKKNLFPDTVHPNPVGAQLMADAIYHTLTSNSAMPGM